ncbi:MAG TPA: 16S rRNA (guanine(966)-N(2))-methyltransferase RsmD [Peptococcaceae bacterium]|nr:MAG: Methyltransferase [Clostridia bacterium 41_269]HBT20039.1 16S rRNA (guanine(966)-N(2))-methyltransferase RsmD [Peptococcaceae bacterium]
MRIIGGKYKGRRLKTPKDNKIIRPTSDRVKEAIFNILGEKVQNSRVLDLFCGTGSLGLEALSRGASHVVFVDKSSLSLKLVKSNLELIGECEKALLIKSDVFKAFGRLAAEKKVFDVVFVDPPYKERFHKAILEELALKGLMEKEGVVVYETSKKYEFAEPIPLFVMTRSKGYGDTKVSFFLYVGEEV